MDHENPASAADPRRQRLLEAAHGTFTRFGFRKTSMEEVARAAGLSRQALYLHFATKEELFRAAVRHTLEVGRAAAKGHLDDESLPIDEKLVGAFDEWVGRWVGILGADVADLEEASHRLVGGLYEEYDARFHEAVAKVIRASALARAYKPAAVSPKELADTLGATARGLKHAATSRADFRERISVAVRALCLPLRKRA